jgi:MFS family permease
MDSPSVTRWHLVIILWLSGVLAAMQFSKISIAFQALQAHYGASASVMGWVLSTVGMVGLLLGAVAGLCAPAIGYRRLLVVGMGLGAVLAGVQSLIPAMPLLWLTRLLEGVSQLSVVVAAPTLIIQYSAPQHRSMVMGLWSTFMGVAFAVTGALGGWVLAQFHLEGLLLTHALGMSAMFLLVLVVVPKDSASRPAWPRLSALPGLHLQLYSHWATALPGLCFFCYTCSAIAMFTFLPQFAGSERVWLAPVLPLVTIVGTLSAGWLAQSWLPPNRLVRWAYVGVALAATGVGIALTWGLAISPVAIVLMYMLGVAGGSSFALVLYLNHVTAAQARATGAVAQLGNMGSTLGPPLVAACIAQFGGQAVVVPAVLFAVLGGTLATLGLRS